MSPVAKIVLMLWPPTPVPFPWAQAVGRVSAGARLLCGLCIVMSSVGSDDAATIGDEARKGDMKET